MTVAPAKCTRRHASTGTPPRSIEADGTGLKGGAVRSASWRRPSFATGKVKTTLRLTTGQTYNRIEGLPIVFGPRSSTALPRHLHAARRAGFADGGKLLALPDDFGYSVRGDIRFNAPRGFGIGGRVYSEIRGIEEHTLPKDEIRWSAFLLQRDNRDYFDAQGIVGSLYFFPSRRLRIEANVRHEWEGSVRATDPGLCFATRGLATQPAHRRRSL
jgi:hypothetical protein